MTLYHVIELISIHAPAKGATHGVTQQYLIASISIHAPAKGATLLSLTVIKH